MPIIMASQSKTAEHHPSPKGGALKIRGLKPKKKATGRLWPLQKVSEISLMPSSPASTIQ
jgi:hypothetical protein